MLRGVSVLAMQQIINPNQSLVCCDDKEKVYLRIIHSND